MPLVAVLRQGRIRAGTQLSEDGGVLIGANGGAFAGVRRWDEGAAHPPLMHAPLDGALADMKQASTLPLARAVLDGADNPFT